MLPKGSEPVVLPVNETTRGITTHRLESFHFIGGKWIVYHFTGISDSTIYDLEKSAIGSGVVYYCRKFSGKHWFTRLAGDFTSKTYICDDIVIDLRIL